MNSKVLPEVTQYLQTLPTPLLVLDTAVESGLFFNISNGEVELPSYPPLPQDLIKPPTLLARLTSRLDFPKRAAK